MLQGPKLVMRRAAEQDMVDLWLWRNDKLSRLNSLSTKKIAFSEHRRWFKNTTRGQRGKIYIATIGQKKIGMIRFDFPGKSVVQISINVNPHDRRLGFGQAILKQASHLIKDKYQHHIQKAIIKTSNIASEKIFSAAGFVKIHDVQKPTYSVWIKR